MCCVFVLYQKLQNQKTKIFELRLTFLNTEKLKTCKGNVELGENDEVPATEMILSSSVPVLLDFLA